MSNYSKTTNFTAKDALSSGDPNKIIKGEEHDTEFDNIAAMSQTKTNKVASPTSGNVAELTGTGDLSDGGFSFPNLSGAAGLDITEIGILEGATLLTDDINILAGAAAAGLTAAELQYVQDVTSGIQAQLDTKHTSGGTDVSITDGGTGSSTASGARSNLGLTGFNSGALYLGSESDGSVTISSNTNISAGEYHYSSLTIDSGRTLGISDTSGYLIIRCTGTVIIAGTISANGKGSSGAAQNTGTTGSVGGGGSGGGSGAAGGGDDVSNAGGSGGATTTRLSSVAGGVGDQGTGNNGSTVSNIIKNILLANVPSSLYILSGAGGGSGGRRLGYGGAGGAGGGSVIIIADTIDFQTGAALTSTGSNGSNGSSNSGGGGGGAGGSIMLFANTITNDGTVTITGGSGGSGAGGGDSGGTGGSGYFSATSL